MTQNYETELRFPILYLAMYSSVDTRYHVINISELEGRR
jgi:hypothetical protein